MPEPGARVRAVAGRARRQARRALALAARRSGLRSSPTDRRLRAEIRTRLAAAGPGARVAVLAERGRSPRGLARRLVRERQVSVLRARLGDDPVEHHADLALGGRLDLLVIDAVPSSWPVLLKHNLYHLGPGGVLLFRGVPGQRPRRLLALLRELDRMRVDRPEPPLTMGVHDLLALADSVRSWRRLGPHVEVVCGADGLAKIRYEEMDALLDRGEHPRGRIHASVPAVSLKARCPITQTMSEVRWAEPRVVEAPRATLREHHDVVCLPRQTAVQGNILLPDTFRHGHRPRYRNSVVEDLNARFATVEGSVADAVPLEGAYFHLDSEFQGHFGHLLTEQVARLWAWPRVRELEPDVRVLVCSRRPREQLFAHERDVFGALGIEESRVTLFEGPVRVETLYAATPMWSHPAYVHPEILETWRAGGEALAAQAPARDYPRRIFCSRRTRKRACLNEDEVEAFFAARGYEVLYPETFSVPEQAALFREAEVVAGYAGSALFNLIWTAEPKHVVMLVSESYTAENEFLIAAVQGHPLTLVWCPALVPLPERGFSADAYTSDYRLDFARDGAWLEARLDEIE